VLTSAKQDHKAPLTYGAADIREQVFCAKDVL